MSINHRSGAQRSEAARTAILSAAAQLFADSGYERLTMEGIASAAKVGKQTIYRWWPSKSALIAECLADGYLAPTDRSDPPAAGHVVEDITTWLATLIDFSQRDGSDRVFLSLVSAAAGDPEVARHVNERLSGGHTLNVRLQQGVDAGELSPDVPMHYVAEALIGTVIIRLLARSPMTAEVAPELVDLVLGRYVTAGRPARPVQR